MNRWKCTITAIIFTWSVLLVPDIDGRVYADSWVDGTPYFYEEARFLTQVLGHGGEAMFAPSIIGTPKAAVYKVGDSREFYAVEAIYR